MSQPPAVISRPEMRSRIIATAVRLLSEQGSAALTTRGVAAAAGVQAPTIYRLFGDKEGLLDAVAEHQFAGYVTGKTRAGDTDDPVADLRAGWDEHIRFGLDNPALYALLVDPERGARSPAAAAGRDVLRARVHRVAAAGRLRVPERRAAELIRAAGVGAVLSLLSVPAGERDPHLADAMYEAVTGFALTDAAGPDTDRAASAAIALRAVAGDLAELSAAERTLLTEWLDRVSG